MEMYYRKVYIDKLLSYKDRHYIKILTGIRRSGKSTILKQYRKKLIEEFKIDNEQIIEYDFSNPKFEVLSYMELYDQIIKKAHKKKINYVFLDEIQDIAS
jgi:predicted AAA+ superfamily ATPase